MRVLSKLVGGRSVALAVALSSVLAMVGCASNNSSSSGSNITATPTLSPGAGTYTVSQTVTIADTTKGAVLYCTTDGTTPTTSSPLCSQPTTVFKTEFLQAIAVAPGMAPSAVASAGFTINPNTVAAPTFNPAGGTFAGTQMITIMDTTPGANIFYTLDGTSPSSGSTLYTAPVSIAKNATLSAIAIVSGLTNSPIVTAAYTIQAAIPIPTISSLSPTSANAGGVAFTLTVNGTNFVSGSTVQWNGTALTTSFVNATQLTASVPANLIASAGTANVTVAEASGVSGGTTFTISSAPTTVTSLSPNTGAAGTSVTITGTNFTGATAVNFGSAPATFTVTSPTSIMATSPTGTGTVDVKVVTPNGTSATSAADQYTYPTVAPTVTGISPALGSPTGGTSVTITGTNFTGATAVNFGSTPGTITATSATSITATSPAGTGTVDVTVVVPGATSATSAADTFTYGGATLTGTVVSGALPIAGATVQVYVAGTSGYGAGSSAIGTVPTVVTTSASGSFTLQYACPSSGAPADQMYVVATGGDSGGGANTSIALMTALGTCANAPGSVTVNEVTTVASAYALSAFATVNSSGGITVGAPGTGGSCNLASGWQSTGPDSCNYNGLVNAFKAVKNLVNIAMGTALTHTPDYTVDLAGDPNILNNSTVPTTRINALADMLASCVESSSSSCGSGLFTAAKTTVSAVGVPTPVTPVDTLQAALNIAQNPGNNVSNLLGLVSSTPPYSLTSPDPNSMPLATTGSNAPTDLTLALTFTGGGLGMAPSLQFSLSDGSFGVTNNALGIDAAGNVWVGGGIFTSNFFNTNTSMLAEFNALGAPITKATTLNGLTPTYGGFDPEPTLDSPFGNHGIGYLTIDQSGSLWTDDGNGNLLEIGQSLSVLKTLIQTFDPINLTIDSSGNNVWFLQGSSPANVSEVQGNGTAGVAGVTPPQGIGLGYLTFDSGGGLWSAGQNLNSNSQGGVNSADVFQLSTQDGSLVYDAFPTSTLTRSFGTTLVADNSGNVYGCDPGGVALDVFSTSAPGASSTPVNLLAHTYSISNQRGCGNQLVLDGLGHLFAVTNAGFSSFTFSPGANIDEFTTGGTLVSPMTNGYIGSSSTETPTLNPDPNWVQSVLGVGAAMDGSGNLWVLNSDTFGNLPGNALVEYIGMGAPVVTPAALSQANGVQGTRP